AGAGRSTARAAYAGGVHPAGSGAHRAHTTYAAHRRAAVARAKRNPGTTRRDHRRSAREAAHVADAALGFGWSRSPGGQRTTTCGAHAAAGAGSGAICASAAAASTPTPLTPCH